MKQQAPKTLPQKAETIENTRKTADILIGAACHKNAATNVAAFLYFRSIERKKKGDWQQSTVSKDVVSKVCKTGLTAVVLL